MVTGFWPRRKLLDRLHHHAWLPNLHRRSSCSGQVGVMTFVSAHKTRRQKWSTYSPSWNLFPTLTPPSNHHHHHHHQPISETRRRGRTYSNMTRARGHQPLAYGSPLLPQLCTHTHTLTHSHTHTDLYSYQHHVRVFQRETVASIRGLSIISG